MLPSSVLGQRGAGPDCRSRRGDWMSHHHLHGNMPNSNPFECCVVSGHTIPPQHSSWSIEISPVFRVEGATEGTLPLPLCLMSVIMNVHGGILQPRPVPWLPQTDRRSKPEGCYKYQPYYWLAMRLAAGGSSFWLFQTKIKEAGESGERTSQRQTSFSLQWSVLELNAAFETIET